ncbi:LOB domain-containing protein 33-like [Pyrus ussuriensis x Pyrus communis]|uniref:LOB domain-containing protein 33-like n=1 Tax=Pyrus ussuriensis x Pyrus communis TaxID=2448454 RepID=A0A5N5FAL9_9ROSA|nr:LOB domain-containing protein 33-like [Pyrus x bretschneideri]KAB2598272.1 LOB domain-containing protein 33-like [Pyrus ussuriensis x Pyrus communis]
MAGLGSSCGACKFLRRKCTSECIFAPYFCYDQAADHFAAVHKVFGASNVSKLLLHLPVQNRSDAAITMSYEALARMRDPVYGCVSQIYALQQQVAYLQEEIETLGSQMIDFATFHPGNSNTFVDQLQVFSQHDAVDTQHIQNQLPESPIFPQIGSAAANQGFNGEMDIEMPPLQEWEEVSLFGDHSTPDPLKRFLESMEQDNLGNNPWPNETATWDLY